ncbi:unnamed protein product [Paramecium sonneborni]|uniref:Uncharacterized protein n=1 Tax=Paramecium sonneborni TaxID=65129 RepID=A0A8S1NRQ5_9CILI|nr:unnamed protein product [Paramecium sonneborni]
MWFIHRQWRLIDCFVDYQYLYWNLRAQIYEQMHLQLIQFKQILNVIEAFIMIDLILKQTFKVVQTQSNNNLDGIIICSFLE